MNLRTKARAAGDKAVSLPARPARQHIGATAGSLRLHHVWGGRIKTDLTGRRRVAVGRLALLGTLHPAIVSPCQRFARRVTPTATRHDGAPQWPTSEARHGPVWSVAPSPTCSTSTRPISRGTPLAATSPPRPDGALQHRRGIRTAFPAGAPTAPALAWVHPWSAVAHRHLGTVPTDAGGGESDGLTAEPQPPVTIATRATTAAAAVAAAAAVVVVVVVADDHVCNAE